ncbi:MAG TPA: lytic murein transglycosylase, partial [Bdellovibrio sp.]
MNLKGEHLMNRMTVSILYTCLLISPASFAQEDIATQVVPQILGHSPEDSRPWRAPTFAEQNKALGYSENAFAIPKGMEKQVQFWVDIYTKYSSNQGVIHDAENVENVYEVVDLTGLTTERAKQKKIDQVKAIIGLKLNKEEKDRLRFQLGQKDRMQEAIFFSGRYLEEMEKIFRDAGVPMELTRLAVVESSFNIMARSKVGASG